MWTVCQADDSHQMSTFFSEKKKKNIYIYIYIYTKFAVQSASSVTELKYVPYILGQTGLSKQSNILSMTLLEDSIVLIR